MRSKREKLVINMGQTAIYNMLRGTILLPNVNSGLCATVHLVYPFIRKLYLSNSPSGVLGIISWSMVYIITFIQAISLISFYIFFVILERWKQPITLWLSCWCMCAWVMNWFVSFCLLSAIFIENHGIHNPKLNDKQWGCSWAFK